MTFGVVYTLLEKGLLGNNTFYPSTGNPYSFKNSLFINSLATFLMGLFQGVFEFYVLRNLFSRRKLWIKIIFKTFIYVLIIVLFILVLNSFYNSSILEVPVTNSRILKSNIAFIESFSFLSVIVFVTSVVLLCLLFSEIIDFVGQNVLTSFFAGRYHSSRTEERIFMFLDMKSSTSIAERLGHVQFYRILNRYYADMTRSIQDSSGEIYQYAGDSIILSWRISDSAANARCLEMFFSFKETLLRNRDNYKRDFGLVPEFKAGIHCGRVTMGQIGVIKKEIVFTGDVLNTTERIQSLCNEYHVDLLISEGVMALLPSTGPYEFAEIGITELKGKKQKVKLYMTKDFIHSTSVSGSINKTA